MSCWIEFWILLLLWLSLVLFLSFSLSFLSFYSSTFLSGLLLLRLFYSFSFVSPPVSFFHCNCIQISTSLSLSVHRWFFSFFIAWQPLCLFFLSPSLLFLFFSIPRLILTCYFPFLPLLYLCIYLFMYLCS